MKSREGAVHADFVRICEGVAHLERLTLNKGGVGLEGRAGWVGKTGV